MTQEDIELLATDICARVKYDVKVQLINNEKTTDKYKTYLHPYLLKPIRVIAFINYEVSGYSKYKLNIGGEVICIDDCMPYLRPMSSMTEEEFEKLKEYSGLKYEQLDLASYQNETYKCLDFYLSEVPSYVVILVFNWLNRYHFDYRGLIEKGLAIEAPEGMYK